MCFQRMCSPKMSKDTFRLQKGYQFLHLNPTEIVIKDANHCFVCFCSEQGCAGVSHLSKKVAKKLYKYQHLSSMISCCSHLSSYCTAISHNPARLREGLNPARIPILPFLQAAWTASLEFCGSELGHLQTCKFAVCQLLSCSLWAGAF